MALREQQLPGLGERSEDELLPASAEALRRGRMFGFVACRPRAIAASAAGLLLLAACAAVATLGSATGPADAQKAPSAHPRQFAAPGSVRSLLESPSAVEVATRQLMEAGRRERISLPKEDSVRASVEETFRNMSLHLQATWPRGAQAPVFDGRQSKVVLDAMRRLSDVRFQRIGLEVARAVKESAEGDTEGMRRRILERLRPRLPEIRQLRDEVIPAELRNEAGVRPRRWGSLVHPSRERLLRSFDDAWAERLEAHAAAQAEGPQADTRRLQTSSYTTPPPGTATPDPQAAAHNWELMSSVLSEGKMLLDQFKVFVMIFGANMDLPEPVKVMLDSSGYFVQLAECGLGSVLQGMSVAAMMMCPLELGEQGMEAITQVMDMLTDGATDFTFGDDDSKK